MNAHTLFYFFMLMSPTALACPAVKQATAMHNQVAAHAERGHTALGDAVKAMVRAKPNADDKAFLDSGALNPNYKNWGVVLSGPVTVIQYPAGERPLFQVSPAENGGKAVWVTTFVPVVKNQINVGDRLVFKGFIYQADTLDGSGQLKQYIEGDSILVASTIETL